MAGILTGVVSHVTSGTATTAMMSSILFPVADSLNYNPAILARIIASTIDSCCKWDRLPR